LIINNIEFDHADIFPDLAAIQRQFHHLVRTVPRSGLIVAPANEENVRSTLALGCWTTVESIGANGWSARNGAADGSRFEVVFQDAPQGTLDWSLIGEHNVQNALAALAAARHAGVPVAQGIAALREFRNARRRMEVRGVVNGITVYDDFAHHPTAIRTTLDGLRHKVGAARIIAVLEARSNTMRAGVHKDTLAPSLAGADQVILYGPPDLGWDIGAVAHSLGERACVFPDIASILKHIVSTARPGDHLLIMSNGAFGGIHQQVLNELDRAASTQQADHPHGR
jgi:UDP-N-acetylmuramate: L-alanyl-gamma-D-glutamyl-meso-diaminopimelate ligase